MDYAPLETFLIGECGLTQEQAGWLTTREIEARRDAAAQRARQEWERARWQVFMMMQMHPYMKPHQKARTPQAWISFPWEKEAGITTEDTKINGQQEEQLATVLHDFIKRKRK